MPVGRGELEEAGAQRDDGGEEVRAGDPRRDGQVEGGVGDEECQPAFVHLQLQDGELHLLRPWGMIKGFRAIVDLDEEDNCRS